MCFRLRVLPAATCCNTLRTVKTPKSIVVRNFTDSEDSRLERLLRVGRLTPVCLKLQTPIRIDPFF